MADNEEIFGLYERDIRRLEAALRQLQNMVQGKSAPSGAAPSGTYDNGFWAKITGKQDPGWKYSWEKMKFADVDHPTTPCELVRYQESRTSGPAKAEYNDEDHHYAVETFRSSDIPVGQIVWMTKPRYQPFFTFDYGPRTLLAKIGTTKLNGYDPIFGSVPYREDLKLQRRAGATVTEDTESNKPFRVYNLTSGDLETDTLVYITYMGGDLASWEVTGVFC